MLQYKIATIILSLLSLSLGIKLNEYKEIINKLEKSKTELEEQLVLAKTNPAATTVTIEKMSDSNVDLIYTYSSIIGTVLIFSIIVLSVIYVSDNITNSQNTIIDQINEVKMLSSDQSQKILEITSKNSEEIGQTINAIQHNIIETSKVNSDILSKLTLENINKETKLCARIFEDFTHGNKIVSESVIENSEINALIADTLSQISF